MQINGSLQEVEEMFGKEFADNLGQQLLNEKPVLIQLRGRDIAPETTDRPTYLLLLWATGRVWFEPVLELPEWAIAIRGTWDSAWS